MSCNWSDLWFWAEDAGPGPRAGPGWYPILQCWKLDDGFFPGGAFWTGREWGAGGALIPTGITHWAPCCCENVEAARDMAYRHDPEP